MFCQVPAAFQYSLLLTLNFLGFQEASGLDGSCRTHPCRGDHLAEMRIRCLACREHTGDACFHPFIDRDIAQVAHIQLAFEHLGVGRVTDEYEQAIRFIDGLFTRS